jgi:hypothetical protein
MLSKTKIWNGSAWVKARAKIYSSGAWKTVIQGSGLNQIYGAIGAAFCAVLLMPLGRVWAIAASITAMTIAAIAKELYDRAHTGLFDLMDIASSMTGAAIGAAAVALLYG